MDKISIHAPREGGDAPDGGQRPVGDISIHAPREGGDRTCMGSVVSFSISIHAPRVGGDIHGHFHGRAGIDFNPRPPRGGRR